MEADEVLDNWSDVECSSESSTEESSDSSEEESDSNTQDSHWKEVTGWYKIYKENSTKWIGPLHCSK